jgi:hypothetical protein
MPAGARLTRTMQCTTHFSAGRSGGGTISAEEEYYENEISLKEIKFPRRER